ncbi:MAG TPA: zf-HC2 domain-containing protein [Tepidisphaeraceae bacterium]|nr:zf-HC2 domain-containing protein [Tepidisphaeraceae bacterium]
MSCQQGTDIQAYHDGELSPDRVASVEAHLAGCGDCRALLADLGALAAMVRSAPLAPAPAGAVQRLADRAWNYERDRGVMRISAWLTGVAAAVLVGSMLYWPTVGASSGDGNAQASAASAWQTSALMPPADAGEDVPDVVIAAQWIASDLSAR